MAPPSSNRGGYSFNTQPPEGGWMPLLMKVQNHPLFQHTAARRRLASASKNAWLSFLFQHTAARRRLV